MVSSVLMLPVVMIVSRLELSMHPPQVLPIVSAKLAVQVMTSPVFPLLTWQGTVV